MSAVLGILIGLLVLVRVIGKQVTGSLVTQKSLVVMPLILLGVGVLSLSSAVHSASTGELAFLALDCVVLLGAGFARGASIRLTQTADGLYQKGTVPTLLLWLLTIALRVGASFASAALWPHSTFSRSAIALTVGLTIGAQNAMIYRRSLAMNIPLAAQRA
ncbi:hypothetical protein [Kribbella speibonae]|uniref:DUF1453 domain-containing protein n=1 Tax=Kribbella speibonae TaxID=1572660 RepID=A0A4R0ISC9_9ACTN|nr:hypothetical protein [Kribbella speibonae]TCC27089.1 hypothetical protein E0H58_03615 [Kribbella speibonae]TCC36059.1 hypothetical protein E0H92_25570 [Kribbella speibonae]